MGKVCQRFWLGTFPGKMWMRKDHEINYDPSAATGPETAAGSHHLPPLFYTLFIPSPLVTSGPLMAYIAFLE